MFAGLTAHRNSDPALILSAVPAPFYGAPRSVIECKIPMKRTLLAAGVAADQKARQRKMANFRGYVMPKYYAFCSTVTLYEGTGEGGIRTLGSLLGYGALAKRCFRPLSHLTKLQSENIAGNQAFPIRNLIAETDSSCARDFIGVANYRLAID